MVKSVNCHDRYLETLKPENVLIYQKLGFELVEQRPWGRTEYFRRRRGERPMPPSEQALMRQFLDKVGAPSDLDFDAFQQLLAWYD